MGKYVLRRVLELIPALILISFVVFWLMSLAGDPAETRAGMEATPEQIEALREAMGLNRPLLVRYFEFMKNMLTGNLGDDIYGNAIWPQITERFPLTLLLVIIMTAGSTLIAIPAGVGAALNKGSWGDTALTAACLFFNCMPVFWLGMILQTIFSVKLGWLPTSGITKGVLLGLILPSVASMASGIAPKCRQTRSSMLDNLNADYMRTALAKGVKHKKAVYKHALPNALLPIITVVGTSFAVGLAGSVALETVFAWPGIGTLIVPGVRASNYPLVCAAVIVMTVMVGAVNLIVDVIYAFADPRVKARYTGK